MQEMSVRVLKRGMYLISGAFFAASGGINSEVFWAILGRSGVVSMAFSAIGVAVLLLASETRFQFVRKELLLLLVFLCFPLIVSIFYIPFFSLYYLDWLVVAKLAYSIIFIFLVFSIKYKESCLLYLFLGFLIMTGVIVGFVLAVQGDVDSSGNLLSLLVISSLVVILLGGRGVGLGMLSFSLFFSFRLEARTALILGVLVVFLVIFLYFYNRRGQSFSKKMQCGPDRLFLYSSVFFIFFTYGTVLFVAMYFSSDFALNALLTYRPIIWGAAIDYGELVLHWFVPPELLDDVGYHAGAEVFSYYGWTSDIKEYTAHNFFLSNLTRLGVVGALGLSFSLVLMMCRFRYWASVGIFVSLVNGLTSSVIIGTANMFGILLLLVVASGGSPGS